MKMERADTIWFTTLPGGMAKFFRRLALNETLAAAGDGGETGAVRNPQRPPSENNGALHRALQGHATRRPEIMVPVDFTPESLAAADYAINVARRSQARLVLLHAIHLNLTPYGPANPTWLRAALCREALEKMEGTMVRAQDAGVPTISVIEEGAPAKVISQAARRWKIDLMVMAVKRRGKWARLFGHRIKEKLVRELECPIVVIQMDGKKGATV